MKVSRFNTQVDDQGRVILQNLPPHQAVEVLVLLFEPNDPREDMQSWFDNLRKNYPNSKITLDELLQKIRETHEYFEENMPADRY